MSAQENTVAYFILLAMVGVGALVFVEITRTERMAKAGFYPSRLAGDAQVYWMPIPGEKADPVKGF